MGTRAKVGASQRHTDLAKKRARVVSSWAARVRDRRTALDQWIACTRRSGQAEAATHRAVE